MEIRIPKEVQQQQQELVQYLVSLGIEEKKIKNTDLLLTAFIHKSYAADFKEISAHNERLEFVGDGILGGVVTKLLFLNNPEMEESEMTLYKIALVREETLAEIAKEIWLDQKIFLSKGEERAQGREKETILGDALEALLGYLYIDIGEPEVFSFIERHLYQKINTISKHSVKSYKTLVQEHFQKETKITPVYQDTSLETDEKGNTLQYKSELIVDGEIKAEGLWSNKKKAQENAAKNFYETSTPKK